MRILNLVLLFFFLFSINSYSLPKCKGDDPTKWNRCIGTAKIPVEKWDKGINYTGEFRQGLANGKGLAIWINDKEMNRKWEGLWKKGKRHGLGIGYVDIAGGRCSLEGKWKNGKKDPKNTYNLTCPESVLGRVKSVSSYMLDDGTFIGNGEITFRNGTTIKAVYDNGVLTRAGQWYVYSSEDEFDGRQQKFFFSGEISPNKPLSFPYKNSDPILAVGCEKRGKKDHCWTYMKFKALNLTGGDIRNDYTEHYVRVKLESGKIETFSSKNNFGSDAVFFINSLILA